MGTFSPFGAQTYYLNGSISSTATSIVLSSFAEPVSGTLYTMALLNTDIVYATISPKTTSSEFISFTGITQNADGTATLTGVTRGLAKKYPFTASSTFRLPHSGQSQFIISNPPQLYNEYVTLDNTETIAGLKTFTLLPRSTAGNATLDTELITYAQALAMATGTTSINRVVVAGTAGATITIGQTVYLDDATNTWKLTDADTPATVNNVIKGIAQGAGTSGNPITSGVLLFGLDSNQSGLTPGAIYYFGNTAGALSATPGTTEVTAGQASSATSIIFYSQFNQQLTEDQQDALAGNGGTPSSTNKFGTQAGIQAGSEQFIADASASSTAYTATLAPAITAYTDGMRVYVKIGLANTTTTPTLAVNGLTARTIVKLAGTALAVGDIGANSYNTFIYDLTNTVWVLQNPVAIAPLTSIDNNLLPQIVHVPNVETTPNAIFMTTAYTGVSSSNPIFTAAGGSAGGTAPTIARFVKTGNGGLVRTHKVEASNFGADTAIAGIAVVGSYVYVHGSSGGATRLIRLAIADLTGETLMTQSGTSMTVGTTIFSDGTNLYNIYTNDTAKIYTISGTTVTSGADTSYGATLVTTGGTWCDGTSVYQFVASGNTYKWALAGGARTSGSTFLNTEYLLAGTAQSTGGGIFKEVGNSTYIQTFMGNITSANQIGTIVQKAIF